MESSSGCVNGALTFFSQPADNLRGAVLFSLKRFFSGCFLLCFRNGIWCSRLIWSVWGSNHATFWYIAQNVNISCHFRRANLGNVYFLAKMNTFSRRALNIIVLPPVCRPGIWQQRWFMMWYWTVLKWCRMGGWSNCSDSFLLFNDEANSLCGCYCTFSTLLLRQRAN